MKVYYLKSQITHKDTFKGLLNAAFPVIIALILTALIMGIIIYKTSDSNFCPRIYDIKVRQQLGCPVQIG